MSKSVPDEWVNGKFGDLARVQNGYAFKSSDFSERGHAAAIRMSNLKKGRIDLSDAKYLPESIVEGLDQFRLSEGDFLFGMSGSLDNYAWVPRDTGICYLNQRVGCLRAKPKSDSLYTAYCYLSETVKQEIVGLAAGAAQLNISGSQLEAIPVPIPPLPEQQKIAAILSSVDDVIEKTRAQIDKLKDLKTGMMQELLTKGIGSGGVPHTEFKDSPVGRIPVEWDVVRFKDVFSDYKYGPRFSSKDYSQNGNVKTIRGTDLSNDGEINYTQVPTASIDSKIVENHQLRDGDLVMITTAECGSSAVFREQKIPYIASAYAIKLSPTDRVSPEFIKFFMQTPSAMSQIESFIRKGTVANLPGSDVMNIILALPTYKEQEKIASRLQTLDTKIEKISCKATSLTSLKKALMQDLLTGKVRVNTEQKESVVA